MLVEIGSKFCKVGYVGECEPLKILRTPLLFDRKAYFKDVIRLRTAGKSASHISVRDYWLPEEKVQLKLEELVYDILYKSVFKKIP